VFKPSTFCAPFPAEQVLTKSKLKGFVLIYPLLVVIPSLLIGIAVEQVNKATKTQLADGNEHWIKVGVIFYFFYEPAYISLARLVERTCR